MSDAPDPHDAPDPQHAPDPHDALAGLYADDVREHSAGRTAGTPEYRAMRARDAERRRAADRLLAELRGAGRATAADLYHAAWLLNHGDAPDEARRAHELARAAAEIGGADGADGADGARWLAAAAYDRWCMYDGRPQRYGTQLVPDGVGIRVWDVETPDVGDAERARWGVPPLDAQRRRAAELSRTERQPPMEGAPAWLRAALARWRAAEG